MYMFSNVNLIIIIECKLTEFCAGDSKSSLHSSPIVAICVCQTSSQRRPDHRHGKQTSNIRHSYLSRDHRGSNLGHHGWNYSSGLPGKPSRPTVSASYLGQPSRPTFLAGFMDGSVRIAWLNTTVNPVILAIITAVTMVCALNNVDQSVMLSDKTSKVTTIPGNDVVMSNARNRSPALASRCRW